MTSSNTVLIENATTPIINLSINNFGFSELDLNIDFCKTKNCEDLIQSILNSYGVDENTISYILNDVDFNGWANDTKGRIVGIYVKDEG